MRDTFPEPAPSASAPSGLATSPPASVGVWCARVDRLMEGGELLAAFDLSQRGLDAHPGALGLQIRAILALCRADVSEHAEALYAAWDMGSVQDRDAMALVARIAKNRARGLSGRERRDLFRRAGAAYKAVFDQHGGHYPAINAATTFLLAGDRDLAELMARRCLAVLDDEAARGGGGQPAERYYQAASRAEAHLVLGDEGEAARWVGEAAATGFADLSARAATRRQMRLVCAAHRLPDTLLAPLAPPHVLHYLGHRVFDDESARFPARLEAEMAAAVREALARAPVGAAIGSLAAGADILFAEALLDAGVDLTVVLPADAEVFAAVSVRPSGAGWEARYRRCLARANRVMMAGDDDALEHDSAFDYCSRVAMGLAVLQARHVDAVPLQLALWDGRDLGQAVGTEADVRGWRAAGHAGTVIPIPAGAPPGPARTLPQEPFEHRVMAMLFADAVGFSRLGDRRIRRYHADITHRIATVLDRHAAAVRDRNSWGDGLFVLFDDVPAAADCALAIQEAIRDHGGEGADGAVAALGADREPGTDRAPGAPGFRLRMSLHAGPVFAYDDPIRGCRTFGGRHVTRAARGEPIAPPGEVMVTEPVAALLALHAPNAFLCEYVGHRQGAKATSSERMFVLRRLTA